MLQTQPLRLRDTEIREQETTNAHRAPDEEHFGAEIGCFDACWARSGLIDEIGCSVADSEIPEPVGSGREGHGFGTDLQGVNLAGDHPSNGTPGGGEEADI